MLKKMLSLTLAMACASFAVADEADVKKAMEAKLGAKVEAVSKSGYLGLYEVYADGAMARVPGVAASAVLDPTGCGDAFRAALLHGLLQGWPLLRCAELGNRMGATKIACRGGQNYTL